VTYSGCRTNVVCRHPVEAKGSTDCLISVNASGMESGVFRISRAYPSDQAIVTGEERLESESWIGLAQD